MVLLCKAVECCGKIAMTTLHSGGVTMGLLPDRDLLRLIILGLITYEIVNQELSTVVSMRTKFRLRP
jgi:hypothetical protein